MTKIMLDAGHGYNTPGKRSPNGMREYEFNRAVANHVKVMLSFYKDVTVFFAHDDSRDVPLSERTRNANSKNVDVYVSIHANAHGAGGWTNACGIETFVYTTKPTEALSLAACVQNHMIRETGRVNRGVKTADFQVLRETHMTSILIEAGFMTNKEEAALLKSDAYRQKVATAIVKGLVDQYKLVKQPSQTKGVVSVAKDDIKGTWGEASIRKAIEKGIIPGYSNGSWQPNRPITRADIAVILDRLGLLK